MSSRGAGPHDHEPARQPTLAAYAPEPVLPPAASAPDWRSRQGRWVDRSLSGRHHLPCCRGLFRPVAKSNPCTIPRSKRQRPSYRSRPHTPNLWTVPREPGRDRSLANHARDRRGDELRLVEQCLDAHAGGRGRTGNLKDLANAIDDGERRGAAILDDAHQHGTPAIFAHDVLLHQPAVVHLADVLHVHRLPVDILDRNIVEVGKAALSRIKNP